MATVVAAWPMVALGEMLTPVSRPVRVKPAEMYPLLGMHWYAEGLYVKDRKLGTQIQADTVFQVHEGDFVYNRLFAWKGSFGLAESTVEGCYVSNEFPCFLVDKTKVLPEFLQWYFSQSKVWEAAEGQSSGSTPTSRLRLKEPQLLAMHIPLPPLDEQRRIVARIEGLAARIEQARGLRREAMAEADKLLPASITDALSTISTSSDIVTVASVADSVTDGDHQPPPRADHGVPFLFISNVAHGVVDFTNCRWVTPEYFRALQPARIPHRGDVLYTAVGSYGIPCLVDTDMPFCFQRHIAIIKPDRKRVLPEYLAWVLASSDVVDQATRGATGSAQLTVPLATIRNLSFPLPEMCDQQRIVTYLDSARERVYRLKEKHKETMGELDALLPSVLDKAFRGEL